MFHECGQLNHGFESCVLSFISNVCLKYVPKLIVRSSIFQKNFGEGLTEPLPIPLPCLNFIRNQYSAIKYESQVVNCSLLEIHETHYANKLCWYMVQQCTKLHHFMFEFSKIFWGGAHRAPSPDPSLRFFSGFALDARALRALGSGFALNVSTPKNAYLISYRHFFFSTSSPAYISFFAGLGSVRTLLLELMHMQTVSQLGRLLGELVNRFCFFQLGCFLVEQIGGWQVMVPSVRFGGKWDQITIIIIKNFKFISSLGFHNYLISGLCFGSCFGIRSITMC